MILRLGSSNTRRVLVVVAALLAAGLSYFSLRDARAAYDAGLGTSEGYERATRLEPGNADNWYLLGHYWQYNLENPDAARALAAYHQALAVDPRSADTWLDMATVLESEDDSKGARAAFLQAKHIYPLSAEVAWRYGNFLLRQGEIRPAFTEIRQAAYLDPKRGGAAFSRCWRVEPDVNAILDNVLPVDANVYLDVIGELSAGNQPTPALTVWSRLAAIHPHLQLTQISSFIDMLIQNQRLDDARKVWDEAVRLVGLPALSDPAGSVVWDGGFETGVHLGGFSWFFYPSYGVQASFDSRQKHSGNQSLRLAFNGRQNVSSSSVCDAAEVSPSTPYVLSGWIRAQSLSTDQGVRLQLSWLQNSQWNFASTSDVVGDQPWTQVQLRWTSPKDVRSVRVCTTRYASDKQENEIQGIAWVDDISLVPESVEKPRP